jgi:hypothetical protein
MKLAYVVGVYSSTLIFRKEKEKRAVPTAEMTNENGEEPLDRF